MNGFYPFSFWVFWFLVLQATPYMAWRLRGKTESGEPKIFWHRFVMYACAISAYYALVFIAENISSGRGVFGGLAIVTVIEIGGSLIIGFGTAVGWLFYYSKAEYAQNRWLFKRLRTGSIMVIFWATFFTVPYFVIVSILGVRMDFAVFPAYPLLFLLGAAGGAIWGISRASEMKDWINGDSVVLIPEYRDQSVRVFLRGCIIVVLFVPAPILLSGIIPDATGAVYGGSLLGFLLGAGAHRLIWVSLYEKRNNVTLVHENAAAGQPVEAAA